MDQVIIFFLFFVLFSFFTFPFHLWVYVKKIFAYALHCFSLQLARQAFRIIIHYGNKLRKHQQSRTSTQIHNKNCLRFIILTIIFLWFLCNIFTFFKSRAEQKEKSTTLSINTYTDPQKENSYNYKASGLKRERRRQEKNMKT